jgi:hypothetical protein
MQNGIISVAPSFSDFVKTDVQDFYESDEPVVSRHGKKRKQGKLNMSLLKNESDNVILLLLVGGVSWISRKPEK